MAESSLSFHCIVCYETFDEDKRYPVVLPCSHTYICNMCANRVDKCMECRTSLFYPLEAGVVPAQENLDPDLERYRRMRRTGQRIPGYIQDRLDHEDRCRKKKAAAAPRRRLPLPKNQVLLSLMEAAMAKKVGQSTDSENEKSSDDEDESAQITAGVSIATGGCGTYAVACKSGLFVVPSKSFVLSDDAVKDAPSPANCWGFEGQGGGSRFSTKVKSPKSPKYSVDSDMTFEKLSGRSGGQGECGAGLTQKNLKAKKYPFKLCFGDKIQVVEFDSDGWARLARGRGYVQVGERSDMVKIGGPKDKACLTEGMIKTLTERWMTLKHEEEVMNRILVGLKKELKVALQEEDMTYEPASSVADVTDSEVEDDSDAEREDPPAEDEARTASREEDSHIPQKPPRTDAPEDVSNPNGGGFLSTLFHGCASHAEDEKMEENIEVQARPLPRMLPLGGLIPHLERVSSSLVDTGIIRYSPSGQADRIARVASVRSHDSTSTSGVDFRTGMSGHMGLQGSHAQPHDHLDREHVRLMSVHTGIARPRRNVPWNRKEVIQSFSSFPGAARTNNHDNVYLAPDGSLEERSNANDVESQEHQSHTSHDSSASSGNVLMFLPVARAPAATTPGAEERPSPTTWLHSLDRVGSQIELSTHLSTQE